MSKNKFNLTLGDQEVTLKFNMGTLRRMKELSGRDPFRSVNMEDTVGMIDFAHDIICAGMMVELGLDKAPYTKDQLDDILTVPMLTEVIVAFTKAYSQDAPEVKDDTQPSPVNVQ